MTVWIKNPQPPEVVQGPQTCWAAAFESWQGSNSQISGIQTVTSQSQLIEWLESGSGLTFESGRATPQGMMLMAGFGLMDLQPLDTQLATIEHLAQLLTGGSLYVVYFRAPGAPAHAIVCYGVGPDAIYVMDPTPGEGLTVRPPDFFTSLTEGAMLVGRPLDVALARGVEESFQRFPPPPASGTLF